MSVAAWILAVRSPRERPMAWVRAVPFTPAHQAMRPYSDRFSEKLRQRPASVRECLEQMDAHAFRCPTELEVVEVPAVRQIKLAIDEGMALRRSRQKRRSGSA